MYSSPVDASVWNQIAQTINELLTADPVGGLFVVLLSVAVFLSLLIGATWAVVKIIKAKNTPSGSIFQEEVFTRNVLEMIKHLVAFNAERDRLSKRHEYIRENAIIRDQMVVVEGAQDQIRNIILIDLTDRIQKAKPEYSGIVSEMPNYVKFAHNVDILLNEIFVFFRRAAKENHMVEKSEEEFFEYVSTKIDRLYTLAKQSIKIKSKDASMVHTLQSSFDANWREIEASYRRLFTEMRIIASRYLTKIDQEEEDFEQRWTEFIAAIPDMLLKGVT